MLNMSKFSEHEEAFITATIYHIEKDWKGQKGVFASKVPISSGYLSEIINRKKCPQLDKQERIAKLLGYKSIYDYIDFGKNLTSADMIGILPQLQMTATATTTPPSPPVIDIQEEADKRHQIVITGFQDKELALKINEALVELEQLEPKDLEDVYNYITKLKIPAAREKKGIESGLQKINQNHNTGT